MSFKCIHVPSYPLVHCGNSKQTVSIVSMSKEHLWTGNKATCLIKNSEYLPPGARMVFREEGSGECHQNTLSCSRMCCSENQAKGGDSATQPSSGPRPFPRIQIYACAGGTYPAPLMRRSIFAEGSGNQTTPAQEFLEGLSPPTSKVRWSNPSP